jgi:hypothetical protein
MPNADRQLKGERNNNSSWHIMHSSSLARPRRIDFPFFEDFQGKTTRALEWKEVFTVSGSRFLLRFGSLCGLMCS